MRDSDALIILKSQLEADYSFVALNGNKHRAMAERLSWSNDEEMGVIALAYTIHNVYTAFAGYFQRVAKFFENHIEGESWHRELLSRMTLDLPGIRPAIIAHDTEEALDELRRFRHLFRNRYKSSIRPDRVTELSATVPPLIEEFAGAHRSFIGWIDGLLDSEERETNGRS